MTKSLRKRHRQVWISLAILFPPAILLSWLVIPNQAPVKLLQSPTVTVLPVIAKTADLPDYIVNLRTNERKNDWQLEWINKTTLRVPSAVIYLVSDTANDISKARLVGRIETSLTYRFALDSIDPMNLPRFILYDFIHQQVMEQINFKP